MREYGKVSPTFWTGTTGRALRALGTESVVVGFYLMTAPGSNMLGLYYQPMLYLAHETGLGLEGASKGLAGCIEAGFCNYDPVSETVWVIEMAAWQIAEELKASDKRCLGIQRDYDALPANPFLGDFFDRYEAAFHLSKRRGGQGAPKALPSKAKEQAKEKEQEKEQAWGELSLSLSSASPPAGDDLSRKKAERLATITDDASAAYNAILAKPTGLLSAVRPKVGREVRQQNVTRILKTAREICEELYGSTTITREFWDAYFTSCGSDPWLRGEGPYTGGHANWRPDFEYLTRKNTVLKVFNRALDEDAA